MHKIRYFSYTKPLALMLEQVCGLKKAWFIFRFFFRILSKINQKNGVSNFKDFRNYHSNVEWNTTAELLTQTLNWIASDFLARLWNRKLNWKLGISRNRNLASCGIAYSNLNLNIAEFEQVYGIENCGIYSNFENKN